MKNIFFLLLFCLVFETILSNNKFAKLFKKIKEKKATKEPKLRKLQETDVSDESGSSNGTAIEPESVPYTGDTSADGAETGSALAFDTEIDPKKPVSSKGYKTGNKNADYQFSKFQEFKGEKNSDKITFFVLLFFKKIIPYRLIFRLRVLYSSRLRNLEETAQSVRTDCTISNEDLVGKSEEHANFDCKANKTAGKEISSVALNTDIDMILTDKEGKTIDTISFDQINFNGNALEEAQNIATATDPVVNKIVTLTEATPEIKGLILTLSGTFESKDLRLRRLQLADGTKINMRIDTKENNQNVTKTYPCTVSTTSGDQLVCDTSSSPIDTTPSRLHYSNGQTGNTLLNVEMKNKDDDSTSIKAQSSEVKYSKSSSGLSGGAIAGIVIACVVVLVAAAIAAIMLRKPSPPIDNSTTAVDLRNDNL